MRNNGHCGKRDWVRLAVERYEGQLMRYAVHMTGDVERARDVVQDTFLRLCAEEPGAIDGHLAEWLFTVCRHRVFDIQRKESRLRPLDEIELKSFASDTPSPARVAEQQEVTSQLLDALKTLPPNQQEVVRLKFQNGLSYQEISGITKLTVTNVGFLLHTAMKTLRRHLERNSSLDPNPLSSYEN
jgi:RNA polymerase sigma factor (sigma-70 family)